MSADPAGGPAEVAPPRSEREFRAVYGEPGLYEQVLLPHHFGGVADDELVRRLLVQHYGPPPARPRLQVVEFGCGTGRVTRHLAPYADRLIGVDSSPAMTAAFAARFSAGQTRHADTAAAVAALREEGCAGRFDVIGAFWSLSYPLGAFLETVTADGIRPVPDPGRGLRQAADLVDALVDLLAPGGHLLALHFDAGSGEQQLVTRAWDTIWPTPFADRGYTLRILTGALAAAERRGQGRLRRWHLTGAGRRRRPRRGAPVVHHRPLQGFARPDRQRRRDGRGRGTYRRQHPRRRHHPPPRRRPRHGLPPHQYRRNPHCRHRRCRHRGRMYRSRCYGGRQEQDRRGPGRPDRSG